MSKLFNLARMSSATTGTGTATLGAAISGYLTFALAGVANGDIVSYGIKDGANSEIGYGTYTSAGTTLTRNVLFSTNANALINLSGTAEIYVTAQASDFPFPDNWLSGLGLVNNGTTSLDILKGVAADSLNIDLMRLAATLTKSISSNWVVGSTNGGLDTGAVAANTWYHVWLIRRQDTGVVDALFSLSATTPTMPGSYAQKRRIGAIKTSAGSLILAFTQVGDYFTLAAPVIEGGGAITVGNARVTQALIGVPTGVVVEALLYGLVVDAGAGSFFWLGPLSTTDAMPSAAATPGFLVDNSTASFVASFSVKVLTDASAQIAMRSDTAGDTVRLSSQGWRDRRGRDG